MKHIKVLLISPASYEDKYDQKLSTYKFFPFSIIYPLNYVKKYDVCDIDFHDIVMEGKEGLLNKIKEQKPELLGFTSSPEMRFYTIDLICEIKKIAPRAKIVVGGFFFSQTAREALSKVPEIDYVVRGEGEIPLLELVRYLSFSTPRLDEIYGLTYRIGTDIVQNKARKAASSIDGFEIDYNHIYKDGYDFLFPLKNWEERDDIRAFPIMLGRGCNNKCIFCMHRHLPYRVLSLEKAIRQIDQALSKFKTRYFIFTDPSFTERKDFVLKLCQHLIDNKYGIKWYCEARADTPIDLLEKMANAGCISVDFALESGSNKVLSALKKNFNVGMISNFAKTCKRLGIRASYFTMISQPEESVQDFEKTFVIIKKLLRYDMRTSIAPLIIFPGTELEQMAKNKGIISKDFSWYDRSFQCKYNFINPRETLMPHYIESMSETQISEMLKRHYVLMSKYLTQRSEGSTIKRKLSYLRCFPYRSIFGKHISKIPRATVFKRASSAINEFVNGFRNA